MSKTLVLQSYSGTIVSQKTTNCVKAALISSSLSTCITLTVLWRTSIWSEYPLNRLGENARLAGVPYRPVVQGIGGHVLNVINGALNLCAKLKNTSHVNSSTINTSNVALEESKSRTLFKLKMFSFPLLLSAMMDNTLWNRGGI